MKRLAFLFVLAAGCVPPAQTATSGAAPAGAPSEGTSSSSTCESGCRHVVGCGITDTETCLADCAGAGLDAATIASIEASSCDELRAAAADNSGGGSGGGGGGGIYSTQGKACVGGDTTCGGINVCCAGGAPAASGQSGTCLSGAICQ